MSLKHSMFQYSNSVKFSKLIPYKSECSKFEQKYVNIIDLGSKMLKIFSTHFKDNGKGNNV